MTTAAATARVPVPAPQEYVEWMRRRHARKLPSQAPLTTAATMPASAIEAKLPVPVSQEYVAQSSTARRHARKAAKAVAAPMTLRRSPRLAKKA